MPRRGFKCTVCNDQGFIDEADAQRLGLDLGDARTQPCPWCTGEHVERIRRDGARSLLGDLVFAVLAIAFLGLVCLGAEALIAWFNS